MRRTGKCPAVHDPRMAALRDVLDGGKVDAPPASGLNWRADVQEVLWLGNDTCGDCVWATACHYIQIAAAYTLSPLPKVPTDAEAIAAYSACTGYKPGDNSTDNGTVVMGAGGMIEYWTRTGIVCGGRRNMLTNAVVVDHTNLDLVDRALALGPVLCGAQLSQENLATDFMFDVTGGPIAGGHEFLVVDRQMLQSGRRYYDIITWDGEFRCTDDWMVHAVDEAVVVLDRAFFDASGVNPAAIDFATVAMQMAALHTDA